VVFISCDDRQTLNCGNPRIFVLMSGRTRRSIGYLRLITNYVTELCSEQFLSILPADNLCGFLKFLSIPSLCLRSGSHPRNSITKILHVLFVYLFKGPYLIHTRFTHLVILAILSDLCKSQSSFFFFCM
jgi:hypothetical protein